MRIGIHTQYYPPETGAPQGRLSHLARSFVERGHEVWVLTAMPNYPAGRIEPPYGGLVRRETREGVRVVRTFIYPTRSVRMARRLASYGSFTASSAAIGCFALPRLDFLRTESPPLFLGMSGWLLSRAKRARWVFNVSDLWPESAVELGIIGEGWPLRASYALEAFCYRKAWLVTGQSREILESVERRFPGTQTYHLSNGVDTRKFAPPAEARQRQGRDGECAVLYAGLLGIAQGLDQVLGAAAILRGRARVRFLLAGDGPEREALRAKSSAMGLDNVTFLGAVPSAEMPALLGSADAALVTLKKALPGAVPSKIYEALGAGLPVAFAGGGEAARILEAAGAGVVVRPGDAGALAAAIEALAADAARRREMGTAGRRAALQLYDRDVIGRDFVRRLEECRGVRDTEPAEVCS